MGHAARTGNVSFEFDIFDEFRAAQADRCRDIRHCGQFNESESRTALIRGDARTEKTELENGLAEAARASHQAAGDR